MSRAQDKEQRRQERLAAEAAAKSAADRRKRFGLVGGAALLAAIVVIVVLAATGGGDAKPPKVGGKAPTFGLTNLSEAARAAGCEVTTKDLKDEGRGHTTKAVKYQTNPPTSGDHDPTAAEDGIYEASNPPDIEQSVHSLEHGRIDFQYKKGTPGARIAQLESMVSEKVKGTAGYHSLLFENQTGMTAAVAATAWRRSITCAKFDAKAFDALRAFRRDRIDKGPEFIP
jgi:hypothetical protein